MVKTIISTFCKHSITFNCCRQTPGVNHNLILSRHHYVAMVTNARSDWQCHVDSCLATRCLGTCCSVSMMKGVRIESHIY